MQQIQAMKRSFKDYTSFLHADGLKGKRIGIEKSHLQGDDRIVGLYHQAIETMKKSGATIIEVDLIKKINDIVDIGKSQFLVLEYEFKEGVNRYLSSTNSKKKNLEDVIAFNKESETKAMPYFKQETLVACQAKSDLNSQGI